MPLLRSTARHHDEFKWWGKATTGKDSIQTCREVVREDFLKELIQLDALAFRALANSLHLPFVCCVLRAWDTLADASWLSNLTSSSPHLCHQVLHLLVEPRLAVRLRK